LLGNGLVAATEQAQAMLLREGTGELLAFAR
jgi:hypothetical protein